MSAKKFYDKINESAFDSYDPDFFEGAYSDRYDPDFADGGAAGSAATATQDARPGQKLQLNLTVNNPTASQIKTELFSPLYSITNVLKPELATGTYTMIPSLSNEGLATIGVGTAGFDQNGNLSINGTAIQPKLTVGCGEYPYISLFESLKVLPFKVAFLRYTVSTNAQISNQITWFQRTFGGGVKQNTINPRAYFKPNQFQNMTIDILAPFTLDGEKGLLIPVNAGEVLTLSLFVQRWSRNSI